MIPALAAHLTRLLVGCHPRGDHAALGILRASSRVFVEALLGGAPHHAEALFLVAASVIEAAPGRLSGAWPSGRWWIEAGANHRAARALAAGAIVIGKTNLDQFATGLVGNPSVFFMNRVPCENPTVRARVLEEIRPVPDLDRL